MVSELRKLRDLLSGGQTAGTMVASPQWHLTSQPGRGPHQEGSNEACAKESPNPPALQYSACLWPGERNVCSQGGFHSMWRRGEWSTASGESRRPRSSLRQAGLLFASLQTSCSHAHEAAASSVLCTNTRPLRLPRALEAPVPPALKSNLTST